MSARDLLADPIWRESELGHAIPPDPHAVSMALPRWQDVIGYEENCPGVMRRLESGYPRFVINPPVRELIRQFTETEACLPFPSARAAGECRDYVWRSTNQPAEIREHHGVHGVLTSEAGRTALKAFWQHTGVIVSTRQAEAVLAGHPAPEDAGVRNALRRQLAAFYDCEETDVFLQPTGMAAQYAALQALMARSPGLPTVQLGFPYVDTLKLQQKLGNGGILLHNLATIEQDLRDRLRGQPVAGCFSELPGNPLLGSADLGLISPLLREQHIPLVADDVVATPFNIDLGPYADLIATSLTKFIAGTGDVMGGALICNPHSPLYDELKSLIASQHEELLWAEDAVVLERQAGGFPERMARHNAAGLLIAERLRAHPGVEQVWYPKWEFNEAYERVRRPGGGYGALITFLPRHAERRSPAIFDNLRLCKGPSLGTVFSLACPFTLLAHYTELDWAESCGVSQHLIRISIGLEEPEELWGRIREALETA